MSDILKIALSAAVPLRILELRSKGGPDDVDLDFARGFAHVLGEKGDILQYRGKKKGETAEIFNGLARAIAVLSFCPGGIKVFGEHWVGETEA